MEKRPATSLLADTVGVERIYVCIESPSQEFEQCSSLSNFGVLLEDLSALVISRVFL